MGVSSLVDRSGSAARMKGGVMSFDITCPHCLRMLRLLGAVGSEATFQCPACGGGLGPRGAGDERDEEGPAVFGSRAEAMKALAAWKDEAPPVPSGASARDPLTTRGGLYLLFGAFLG